MHVPLIDYRLGDDALEVTVFNRTIRRVPYTGIESVNKGWALVNEHWARRLDFWRSAVTVRRKCGFLRNFVITPDEPQKFVDELKARLPKEQGPGGPPISPVSAA